jgi:DeoR family transcriptional regulator, aga operon transcriptional repressor
MALERYERWNAILDLLTEAGRVSVEEAASKLNVSEATIRRDLDQLARQQMIRRTRGGAIAYGFCLDLPLRYKIAKQAQEKQRIGTAAAALVRPGMAIGMNGGTTIAELVRALTERADLTDTTEDPQLTVVTNALSIANDLLLWSRAKVVLTGGVVRPQSLELVGPLGGDAVLREVTLDLVLLGVNAIDVTLGASAHHEGEAAVSSLMASLAREVVVVADSSKLGINAFARICPVERVGVLITDSGADPAVLDGFRQAGIRVILA